MAESSSEFQPYLDLLGDLGRLGASMDRLHAQHLSCRQGCSGCCHQHLGVFRVEATAVSRALAELPADTRQHIHQQAREVLDGTRSACPLLLDESCSIYASRPVICRTHGYPLHYQEEEGEIILDVCPLNFTQPGSLEALELNQTLPLDRLNLRLAAINYVYCRDQLADPGLAEDRLPLAEVVLEPQA
ncbi:MAG TPA: YkgJ family cysteine cluster protein [Candidatus Obscuribacterales bacterium]